MLALTILIGIIPMSTISASAKAVDEELAETGFSPDNFKAQIKKVSIGEPITGSDGKKYLPVDVHFFAAENLSDSDLVYFLEGYMRAQLMGGGLAEHQEPRHDADRSTKDRRPARQQYVELGLEGL